MTGLLLINLGSPSSPNPKDVKTYLDEFLMDEKVLDIPYWKRWILVKGIILNTRPKRSAAAYKKVWTAEGSPLIVTSEKVAQKVQEKLGKEIPVALGMRYAQPSIKNALSELKSKGVDNLLVIPLYPQHAMSSTETVIEKTKDGMKELGWDCPTHFTPAFYNNQDFIQALSNQIKSHIDANDYDTVLFSYHGLPERHIIKSDPTQSHCKMDKSCCETSSEAHKTCYRHQCFETTKNILKTNGWSNENVINSFQSRLGRTEWIKPYTDQVLEELPKEGKKKIAVITPAFVTDCLETLEEIAMEGKEEFLAAGGEQYDVVPCLNEDEAWVDTLVKWTRDFSNN